MTDREVAVKLLSDNKQSIEEKLFNGCGYMFEDEFGSESLASGVFSKLVRVINEEFKSEKVVATKSDKGGWNGIIFESTLISMEEATQLLEIHYKNKY